MEPCLESRDPLLDRGESLIEPRALFIVRAQLADRFGDACRGLLSPAGHLIARDLAPADDVVEQILGTLPRLGRRPGGGGQGALDRRPQRIADSFGPAPRAAPGIVLG